MATENLHFLFIFIPFILVLISTTLVLFCALVRNRGDPLKVSAM